jgi:hypothetical protein
MELCYKVPRPSKDKTKERRGRVLYIGERESWNLLRAQQNEKRRNEMKLGRFCTFAYREKKIWTPCIRPVSTQYIGEKSQIHFHAELFGAVLKSNLMTSTSDSVVLFLPP